MSQEEKPVSKPIKFAIGGISGMMSATILHPMDFLKTRSQMSGIGSTTTEHGTIGNMIKQIAKREGPLAFYNGLSASLLRQSTYTTARLGIYTTGFEMLSANGPISFVQKLGLGMCAGACAAMVGLPSAVCLIRMMSDGQLEPSKRRNYKHVFHALYRVATEEGILAWWTGIIPTLLRGIVVNTSQLATYSQFKQMLLNTSYFDDNVAMHFTASLMSGFVTAAASLPVDIVKTRIQSAKPGENTGVMYTFYSILRKEGVPSFWKGFLPYFMRIGPHSILVFIFYEELTFYYETRILGHKTGHRSM